MLPLADFIVKNMQVVRTKKEMESIVKSILLKNKTIGFVPTMGYLHSGHLSLLKAAQKNNDISVCSIFVNPTQFNNSEDFKLYPRNEKQDFELLETNGCDIVFAPEVDLVNDIEDIALDLQGVDNLMEGKFRPGHFKGVVNIVALLFNIVQPNAAYFGEKDFQQLAIVKMLAKAHFSSIEIMPCSTLREESGLAMSSRNARLSEEEKQKALAISKALFYIKEEAKGLKDTKQLKEKAIDLFFKNGELQLEYLEISDADSLQAIEVISTKKAVVCIAAFCGKVRLIDNIVINY
jgi:pantoate--beta-alanine ligase